MADALVGVRNLSYAHRRGGHVQQVLRDLTLDLDAGEVVVLTGPSGSGKSTLLTIVGGLRSATEGSVRVLGTQLINSRERVRIRLRRGIGFIFQQHNLAPALTVAQNIQMGLQLSRGHRSRGARDRVREAADALGLGDHLHKLPRQLSGGQQQRAGIARALINEPKLVLADEPTASLDRAAGEQVLRLFYDLAERGSAVVLVTHDKRIIEQADRILMMEDGMLVPAADRLMKDTSSSIRTLMQVDPKRLGRMMSFGHALARVALADGKADDAERIAIAEALRARQIFSGAEIELVVDVALAQAQAWEATSWSGSEREDLERALESVAAADSVVTESEREMIAELLGRNGAAADRHA
jgi:putative ABC transport system ATP-binding protein